VIVNLRLPWAPPALAAVPRLADFDAIVIATSAGKDSQTAMRQVVLECQRQGYPLERVHAVHADLGRVEWPGVAELAREQARHYGLTLRIVRRQGHRAPRGGRCYAQGEQYGDLLDHVRRMGFWPRRSTRYCTADHKRDRIKAEIGQIAKSSDVRGRPVRVLNVMGLRASESPDRAKLSALSVEYVSSRREVWIWLPIHGWSEAQVWRDVWASGVRWHPAYDMGMPRLSCTFCVFASRAALRTAAILRPGLAKEYAAVEREIGHFFRQGLSIADLVTDLVGHDAVSLARRYGHEQVAGWQA
jgi:3'-phosphoadenosine 5'-phosphosulfate sulfotransferase (PAPS reductase)/FAD synthetase